jgi:two-component system, sensor histidine kinase RpfC
MRSQYEALRRRLAERPDSEHGQALFRFLIGTLACALILLDWEGISARGAGAHTALGIAAFYITASAIFAHICWRSEVFVLRRHAGITVDVFFVTLALLSTTEPSVQGLVMIYLWIIVGNGLRFGPRYLIYASALSLLAFSFVLHANDFWNAHQWLGWEVFIGQALAALYTRSLLLKLHTEREKARTKSVENAFVARMSREMLTPLSAALEYINSANKESVQRAPQGKLLDGAREELRKLHGLIDDVLDFGKMTESRLKLDAVEVDLRELLLETVAILELQGHDKAVGIDIHMEAGVPSRVYADPRRLRQILLSLGGNAIKFTESGYVRLEIYVVERNAQDDRVALRFAVRDTGVGIAAGKLELVFEGFEQGDEEVAQKHGGAGLGLSIAKGLVELMGGTIQAESEEGKGTVFSFVLRLQLASPDRPPSPVWAAVGLSRYEADELAAMLRSWGIAVERFSDLAALSMQSEKRYAGVFAKSRERRPLRAAQWFCDARALPLVLATQSQELLNDVELRSRSILEWPLDRFALFHIITNEPHTPPAQRQIPVAPPAAPPAPAPLRVLVVDDTEKNLVVTAAMVAREGYSVETTTSGARALDACALEQFDILICDRYMPGMNGITLVSELRKIEEVGGGRTAVIMLTGDTTPSARRAAINAGVDMFVNKPIRPKDLAEAIKALRRKTDDAPLEHVHQAHPYAELDEGAVVDEEAVRELAAVKPENPDFVIHLQADLVNDCYGYLETISHSRTAREYGQIREIAHALFGAAGSVGLVCIARACADFNRSTADNPGARVAEFERELKLAIVAVENYLSDKSTSP